MIPGFLPWRSKQFVKEQTLSLAREGLQIGDNEFLRLLERSKDGNEHCELFEHSCMMFPDQELIVFEGTR